MLIWAAVRSLGTATLLVVVYYLLPLDGVVDSTPLTLLIITLIGLILLIVWQVRAIVESSNPRLRAAESLFSTLPLLLLSFAAAYYLMARNAPHDFSQALTRTDSIYFTVTTFATVGFGDITAVADPARVLVTFQMLIDLGVLGLGLRIFLRAVERSEERQARE